MIFKGSVQPTLHLRLFGAPQIHLNAEPINDLPAKAQALLIYLAITRKSHLRVTLANLLWGEMSEKKALANLRKVLQQLRADLPDHIISDRHSIALRMDGANKLDIDQIDIDQIDVPQISTPQINTNRGETVWVDVAAFENQIEQAQSSVNTSALDDAIQLYAEDFLAGFFVRRAPDFEAWQLMQRAQLRELMLDALKIVGHHQIARNEFARGIETTRRIIKLEPWLEEAHRQLMRLLAQIGDRHHALMQYESCSQLLEQELGVAPSDETVRLYQQIRDGEVEQIAADLESLLNSESIGSIPAGYTLPPKLAAHTSKQLFGINAAQQELRLSLLARERPWLVSIDGIGGVGKTALAQELVNDLSESSHFERLVWVSAKQEEFQAGIGIQPLNSSAIDAEGLVDSLLAQLADTDQTAYAPAKTSEDKELLLRRILTESATLIVVDNLETVADYQALIPTLRNLANPSKFLITSRYSLAHYADVYSLTLGELAEKDAFALLRHEANKRGIPALTTATDETLAQIYAVAGGHPLTLNLLLGQLSFLPLESVLDGLRHLTGQSTDDLYIYIYWQAWQTLHQSSRQLFSAMPLLTGATYTQLAAITQLPAEQLQRDLAQLIGLSLLQVEGDLFEPRYHLHRATETFLANQILQIPTHNILNAASECIDFYQQTLLNGLRYWHESAVVQETNIKRLDRERAAILNLISRGLAFDPAWPLVQQLINAMASYMERRGHWNSWHTLLERAIGTAQRIQDLDGEATMTALLARLAQRQNRGEEIVRCYRRVMQLAKQTGNTYELARAYSNLGYRYIDVGHWWRAEHLCVCALRIFEELENDHGRAHTHNHLGMLYARQSRVEEAESHLEKACKLWDKMSDQHNSVRGLVNLGYLYLQTNRSIDALPPLTQAETLCHIVGEEIVLGQIWSNMGSAYRLLNEYDKALHYTVKAKEIFNTYGDQLGLARVQNNLGWHYVLSQPEKDATPFFTQALKSFQQLHNIEGELDALTNLVRCKITRQEWTVASTYLNQLETAFDKQPVLLTTENMTRLQEFRQQIATQR